MLKDMQRAWKKHLCEGDDTDLAPYLENDSLNSKERLSVYQNAYWVRLVNTLIHDFPLLALEMGNNTFKEMAAAYLKTHEPSGFSLHHLGEHLPRYLSAQLKENHPLVEMAHLERMIHLIRLADNQPILSMSHIKERLAQGEPLLLKIHASVRFFSGQYNTLERWQAFSEQCLRPKLETLSERKHHVLWRGNNHQVNAWLVNDETHHDLSALVTGKSLQEWCDSSSETLSLDAAINRLVNKVFLWAEKGLLVDER